MRSSYIYIYIYIPFIDILITSSVYVWNPIIAVAVANSVRPSAKKKKN